MQVRSVLVDLLAGNRGGQILLAVMLAAAVLVPISSLLLPVDSALHVPTYIVTLVGKYLTFALLALSVDLIWGYAGVLSLGHGAFFALGGYAMGMYMMRQIGDRGVYGNRSCRTSWCSSIGMSFPGTGTDLTGFRSRL